MDNRKEKESTIEIEPPAVQVYVRPLEVTVPADFTTDPQAAESSGPFSLSSTESKENKPNAQQPPRFWSTMTTQISAETSVKRWSIPPVKTEEGQPPGPGDNPETKQGREHEERVKTITPNYKLDTGKPSYDLDLGKTGFLPNEHGDYKMSMRKEDYKLTVIDPKVKSNANMPYNSSTLPDAKRRLAGDFPSEHSKRSFMKLEPLEQRRFKSVESRPITTSNYLTESVNRHRDMEESRLRDYLKAKESDANQPWNKPGWPGPKKDDESLRELEHIKKSIETLQKAANQPPKTDELDELGRKSEELLERSRERRAGYKLMESDIVKEGPEPVPQAFKDQIREMLESRNSVDTATQDRSGYVTDVSTATWQFSQHSFSPRSIVSVNGARDDIMKQRESIWPFLPRALPSVADSTRTSLSPAKGRLSELRKPDRFNSMPLLSQQLSTAKMNNDDRPRGIMKRKELETKDQMMWPAAQQQVVEHTSYNRSVSNVAKPTVTETVQRFEETKRTEEVERRVQRREKKERRSRHHSSSRHHSGYNDGYHHGGYRSSSLSRGGHAGYLPATNETYYRREATRREHHTGGHHRGGFEEESFGGRGLAHARYGSLSDSLRRGELKYVPNGDVKEGYYRDSNGRSMHKSHSTRDVFSGGDATYDHRSASSMRRGSQQNSPFIEYPPSLPRRSDRSDYYAYKPVSKSRSYADWDDAGRAGVGKEVKRYDDDMSRLEAEFRDSLLMPMPNGNLNEKEHRTEQLPGGYETYSKDNRANSGRRVGRDGRPVDFNEATQEYSYKREQEFDDRRRR